MTQQDAPEQGGTVCPFSGHRIPDGAMVCACGAYYGFKGGVLTDQKFGLLLKLLAVSIILLLMGYIVEWSPALIFGVGGTLIFGVVLVAFVLPIKLQGKQWWREV